MSGSRRAAFCSLYWSWHLCLQPKKNRDTNFGQSSRKNQISAEQAEICSLIYKIISSFIALMEELCKKTKSY